jgi:hypothetical protein
MGNNGARIRMAWTSGAVGLGRELSPPKKKEKKKKKRGKEKEKGL